MQQYNFRSGLVFNGIGGVVKGKEPCLRILLFVSKNIKYGHFKYFRHFHPSDEIVTEFSPFGFREHFPALLVFTNDLQQARGAELRPVIARSLVRWLSGFHILRSTQITRAAFLD